MKTVTSVTLWNDSVGKRISITYSEIDPDTGVIISDNNRIDRVITSSDAKAAMETIMEYAQTFVDAI